MTKFKVQVTQVIEVELDETKFDEQFGKEFRESFYPFYDLEDHAQHLGQLYARGLVDGFGDDFIEGYGPSSEMGISFKEIEQYEEIL